ncbi:MAG: flagellar biosynthetic protein FliO [Pirellulaceae bacterium]
MRRIIGCLACLAAWISAASGQEIEPAMSVVPFRLARAELAASALDHPTREAYWRGERTVASLATAAEVGAVEPLPLPDAVAAASLVPASEAFAIPIAVQSSDESHAPRSTTTGTLITVSSSLAIVLGCFLLFVWLMRRIGPRGSTTLPRAAVEVLGRAALDARQQLQLVRVGSKLLLLAVSPGQATALCEINETDEVDYLLHLCDQPGLDAKSDPLREVLRDLHRQQTRTTRRPQAAGR